MHCPLFITCKRCGKERENGLLFRHGKSNKAGTGTNRTCEICTEHLKRKDSWTFEDYEAFVLKRVDLARKGKVECGKCGRIFCVSKKVKRGSHCPTCRRKRRSKEAVQEKLSRWGAESEADVARLKLHRKMVKLTKRSTSPKVFERLAWKHWTEHLATDEQLEDIFWSAGKPWLNPRLTSSEKWALRYRLIPEFQIKERLKRQMKKKARRDGVAYLMRQGLNSNGSSMTVERLLGYSISELKEHLERQFTEGMDWEAFRSGRIHIDHIKPQRLFDLSNDDEWKLCWGLKNLQPLWAEDNLKKGGDWHEHATRSHLGPGNHL